jgi:hypothetical protein
MTVRLETPKVKSVWADACIKLLPNCNRAAADLALGTAK